MGMGMVVAVSAAVLFAATAFAEKKLFPDTKAVGKTVVKFEDDHMRVVVGYRDAVRNLDEEWIFFDLGVTAEPQKSSLTFYRENVELLTPDGQRVALPTQQEFLDGFRDVRQRVKRAQISRDPIGGYFVGARSEDRVPFFSIPGEGVVHDQFSVDHQTAAFGRLYFRAPGGSWAPGLYTLRIKTRAVDAELPLELVAR